MRTSAKRSRQPPPKSARCRRKRQLPKRSLLSSPRLQSRLQPHLLHTTRKIMMEMGVLKRGIRPPKRRTLTPWTSAR